MISKITVTHKCDSCGKEEQWPLGMAWSDMGIWHDIKPIVEEIKLGIIPGWIRSGDLKSWCPNCHMKKEIPIKS